MQSTYLITRNSPFTSTFNRRKCTQEKRSIKPLPCFCQSANRHSAGVLSCPTEKAKLFDLPKSTKYPSSENSELTNPFLLPFCCPLRTPYLLFSRLNSTRHEIAHVSTMYPIRYRKHVAYLINRSDLFKSTSTTNFNS
jgi:hypothetical protein